MNINIILFLVLLGMGSISCSIIKRDADGTKFLDKASEVAQGASDWMSENIGSKLPGVKDQIVNGATDAGDAIKSKWNEITSSEGFKQASESVKSNTDKYVFTPIKNLSTSIWDFFKTRK